jgi:peptide methionine sulfoxide reductase msrA/msrB
LNQIKNSSLLILAWMIVMCCFSCNGQTSSKQQNTSAIRKDTNMKLNKLTDAEKEVILGKGTDRPFTGEYTDLFKKGTYVCRQCDAPLYNSDSKFHSNCGWPSFDDEIKSAVIKTTDADGQRTEITCAKCGGHLGHVFVGEGLTEKNTRHCVNTSSLKFVEEVAQPNVEKAIFAGGCFWGVEYYFQNEPGVISTQVGYTGGTKANPTYKEVCAHLTGHLEAIEVTFDPTKTTYENMAKLFFEIHDPTQTDGQGNDVGPQYLSAVFYHDETQKKTTEKLIGILRGKGYNIATKLIKASKFWPAEAYHQQYYEKGGGTPYCHIRKAKF